MITEQKLLEKYKRNDYLNRDKEHPLVKILVSYIKPAFLFKSEILTPIQLGKVVENDGSKDGIQSEENLKWLHKNCEYNDDFKGGISKHNRRIGFLTGTYWAWKNYEKLGNPEYFGSFGYRRLLDAACLTDISDYDFIIPRLRTLHQKVKDRMDIYGKNLYPNMLKVIKNVSPQDYDGLIKYFERTFVYYDEIYIFKKEQFFKFCEWIFPIIFELLKYNKEDLSFDNTDNSFYNYYKRAKNEERDIAYIAERLTGYYLLKHTKDKSLKYRKVKTILFMSKKTDEYDNKTTKMMLKAIRDKISYQMKIGKYE